MGAIRYRQDIEGMRGIAILLVILYHAGTPGFSGGYIGVDVFFVLSGYLITGNLVAEHSETGRIRFVNFYARRVRRLLPAAALVFLVILFAGFVVFSPLEQVGFAKTAVATALYSSNIWFAHIATDYLAADAHLDPFLHTWSLAVEEQFYFGWPLLVALFLRGAGRSEGSSTRRAMLGMGAITLLSLGAAEWMVRTVQPWAFFLLPFRAWEFALGGMVGLISDRARTGRMVTWVMAVAALAALALSSTVYTARTLFPGMAALLPVVGTALALHVGRSHPDHILPRALSTGWLQMLGRYSYSWYLWHWPVLVLASIVAPGLSLPVRLFLMGCALGLSALTYRLVENPVRLHRGLRPRPVLSVGLSLAVTGLMAGAGVGWLVLARAQTATMQQRELMTVRRTLPQVYADGCHLGSFETDSADCRYGDTTSSTSVVLFGDSHAAQWYPALAAVASQNGWRLTSWTKSACPSANVTLHSTELGRVYRECDVWRQRTLDRLLEMRPALVVLSNASHYIRDGDLSAEDWEGGLRSTVQTLTVAGIPTAILQDTPVPGFDVPGCLSRQAWWRRVRVLPSRQDCGFERVDALSSSIRSLTESTARGGRAALVDLTPALCPGRRCEPARGRTVLYLDDSHISVSAATLLADTLGRALRPLVHTRSASDA